MTGHHAASLSRPEPRRRRVRAFGCLLGGCLLGALAPLVACPAHATAPVAAARRRRRACAAAGSCAARPR